MIDHDADRFSINMTKHLAHWSWEINTGHLHVSFFLQSRSPRTQETHQLPDQTKHTQSPLDMASEQLAIKKIFVIGGTGAQGLPAVKGMS